MPRQRILTIIIRSTVHKRKIDKLNFIKVKNLCSIKDIVKRMRRQDTYYEKIFASHVSEKGPVFRTIQTSMKHPQNPIVKKSNNPVRKWTKDTDRHFT